MISIFAFSLFYPGPWEKAYAGDRSQNLILPGPIPAIVEKVIDGDTLAIRARIWLGQEVRVKVRLSNIDTPELNGRCSYEKKMAHKARLYVVREVLGTAIILTNIRQGKYAGRVIANVQTASGKDLSRLLLHSGFAKPYRKHRYRKWCCPEGQCLKEGRGGDL